MAPTGWKGRRLSDLRQQIVAELQHSDTPKTMPQLMQLLANMPSEEAVRRVLDDLLAAERLHRWGSHHYWSRSPAESLPHLLQRHFSATPSSARRAHELLAPAYHQRREDIDSAIRSLLVEGRLHVLGPAPGPADSIARLTFFAEEPEALILRALRNAIDDAPRDLKSIRQRLDLRGVDPSLALLGRLADRLAAQGACHKWRKDVFSLSDPVKYLADEFQSSLGQQASSYQEVLMAPPGSRLASQTARRSALAQACKAGHVIRYEQRLTNRRRRVRYGSPVAIARLLIADAGARYGVPEAAFREALGGVAPQSPVVSPDAFTAAHLLDIIRDMVARSRSAFLEVRLLREAFGAPPHTFDAAIIELVRGRKVRPQEQVQPNPDPADVFEGPNGRLYGGVTLQEA